MEKQNKLLFLFIVGQMIIYTFIIMLQLMPKSLFWILLICMHSGIVMMIISKKKLTLLGYDVKHFYKKTYLILLLYLPVMFYKLLSGVFVYQVNYSLVTTYTIIVSMLSISFSIINTLMFQKYLSSNK